MTEEIKNTTRIPTETMEEPEQQVRKASTVPDEPSHKEILNGVYNSSDYLYSQFDSRIGKIENTVAKIHKLDGSFDMVKKIGVGIILFLLGKLLFMDIGAYSKLSSIEANVNNINNSVTKIEKRLDFLDNKQQELKDTQKSMEHYQSRINDRNFSMIRQLHDNSYKVYR